MEILWFKAIKEAYKRNNIVHKHLNTNIYQNQKKKNRKNTTIFDITIALYQE